MIKIKKDRILDLIDFGFGFDDKNEYFKGFVNEKAYMMVIYEDGEITFSDDYLENVGIQEYNNMLFDLIKADMVEKV